MVQTLSIRTGAIDSRESGPGQSAVAVTPSDSTVQNYRSLWVGGVGNVAVLMAGDSSPVTFVAVPAGTLLPIAVKKVMLTGTTATNIVGIV